MPMMFLLKEDMDEFKVFLKQQGYPYRAGKGDTQVIQVWYGGEYVPVYKNNKFPDHYTVSQKLSYIMEKYYGGKRSFPKVS